jgi:hypothetical protein
MCHPSYQLSSYPYLKDSKLSHDVQDLNIAWADQEVFHLHQ